MSAELLVANLLRVAREDLEGAKLLADQSNRNAVYLCEQAAEKIIRAILTSEGLHGGIRHQLNEMVDAIPDANPLKAPLREIEFLTAYATSYRYPTSSGRVLKAPSAVQLGVAFAKVAAVLAQAATGLGVDLDTRDAPATRCRPFR
ncbi:MAG: HEPN domain-containing protein [Myxococcales bacterium]|nr:HEPN domain-containing protein [Myxococcales bacterium]